MSGGGEYYEQLRRLGYAGTRETRADKGGPVEWHDRKVRGEHCRQKEQQGERP